MRSKLINSFNKGLNPDINSSVLDNSAMKDAVNVEFVKSDGDSFVLSSHAGTTEAFSLSKSCKPLAAAELGGFMFIVSTLENGRIEIGTYPSPNWDDEVLREIIESPTKDTRSIQVEKVYRPLKNLMSNNVLVDFITDLIYTNADNIQLEVCFDYDNSVNLYLVCIGEKAKLVNSKFCIVPSDVNQVLITSGYKGIYRTEDGDNQFDLYFYNMKYPDITHNVIEGGRLFEGLYNVYVKYANEENEESNLIAWTMPIPITDKRAAPLDSTEKTVNKKIRINLTGIDRSFTYLTVYLSVASGDVEPVTLNSYKYSKRIKITKDNQSFTIDDIDLFTPLTNEEVSLFFKVYDSVNTQAQAGNRLWLASLQTKTTLKLNNVATDFFANIKAQIDVKNVPLDFFNNPDNFNKAGYFSNELYCLGAVLLLNNGGFSPVYPITGEDFATDETILENRQVKETLGFLRSRHSSGLTVGTVNSSLVSLANLKTVLRKAVPEEILKSSVGFMFVRAERRKGYRVSQGLAVPAVKPVRDGGYFPAPFGELQAIHSVDSNDTNKYGPFEVIIKQESDDLKFGAFLTIDTVCNPRQLELLRSSDLLLDYNARVLGARFFPKTGDSIFLNRPIDSYLYISATQTSLIRINENGLNTSRKIKASYVYGFEPAVNDLNFQGAYRTGRDEKYLRLVSYIGTSEPDANDSQIRAQSRAYFSLEFEDYIGMTGIVQYLTRSSDYNYGTRNIIVQVERSSNNYLYEKEPLGALCTLYDETKWLKPSEVDFNTHFLFQDFFPISSLIKWSSFNTSTIGTEFSIGGGDAFVGKFEKRMAASTNSEDKGRAGKLIEYVGESEYNPLFRKETIVDQEENQEILGNVRSFSTVDFRVVPKSTFTKPREQWITWFVQNVVFPESIGYNKAFTGNGKSFFPVLEVFDADKPLTLESYPTRVTWSQLKQPSAFIDGYRYFKPFDYKDFSISKGPIIKIVSFANTLFSFQTKAVNIHDISNRALVNNPSTNNIYVDTSQVLSSEVYELTGEYGIISPYDVFVSDNAIYFVDIMSGCICVVSGKNIEKLSIAKRVSEIVSSWCKDLIDSGRAYSHPIRIGKDFRNGAIYFTFDCGLNDQRTLLYSDYTATFFSRFSSEGLLYGNLRNVLYSLAPSEEEVKGFAIGTLTSRNNNIYNKPFESIISFAINGPRVTKTLDNLQLLGTDYRPYKIEYRSKDGQVAEQLVDPLNNLASNARYREGALHIICPVTGNGSRLRDFWFEITLFYRGDKDLDLYQVTSYIRQSFSI